MKTPRKSTGRFSSSFQAVCKTLGLHQARKAPAEEIASVRYHYDKGTQIKRPCDTFVSILLQVSSKYLGNHIYIYIFIRKITYARLIQVRILNYMKIWYPPPQKSTFFMGKGGIIYTYIYILFVIGPQKKQYYRSLANVKKCKNQKNLEKTKKNNKTNKTNIPELL